MRVLLINAVCGIRSTGRICTDIAQRLESEGHEVKIAYGRATVPQTQDKQAVRIGNGLGVCWHALMSRLFDHRGRWSRLATRKFLAWAEEYDPDVVWLHNIHDYFINIDMLFHWIKSRPHMQVKWTQHDCWAFTGGCMHFTAENCYQWQTQCTSCPGRVHRKLKRQEAKIFQWKKAAFCGVKNMTIIAVSQWIADLVKQSFLKEYPVEVHRNVIDTTVFKPTDGDFRKRFNLEEKTIILGVASAWSQRKGLKDFFALSHMLDESYAIVLVGLDKKTIKTLPRNVVGIEKTNNVAELAQIYTTADVFVNLTYEDTYPTVNLEAQACGTPCITYRTGGSPESVPAQNVVEAGDLQGILCKIQEILAKKAE